MNNYHLTDRQSELLKYIGEYQKEFNTIPSLVELSNKMKITVAGVAQKINSLQRKGILERQNIYLIKQ